MSTKSPTPRATPSPPPRSADGGRYHLPSERSESVFGDFKPPYSAVQALAEANRCLYCHDAPCIQACPTGIDIPEFIRKISTGNVKGSARTIFSSNILGMSCARVCPVEVLCVGNCVYNELGIPPIQIGKLQRYATDRAFDEGWRFFHAGPDSGKRVAVVGGGPAGLSCAHELRRLGHAVTIFEKDDHLGGLNTDGVAPYKMQADRAIEEVDWVLGIGGIEVRTGVTVGQDISWEELDQRHDAVFLGLGLGPDRLLPGSELDSVEGATDWIARMKLGVVDLSGVKEAVVIGGGNTAVDCVRELLGLGVESVTMAYRRTPDRMRGYAHEWAAARKEGARSLFGARPIRFLGEERVRGVRFEVSVPSGPSRTVDLPAQLVLLAIGQTKLGDQLARLGIEVDHGKVVVDETGRTTRPGWYAGGDLANGGKEVVNAVAAGRDAARGIHQFLTGGGDHA